MSGNNTHPTYSAALFNTYTIAFEGICISCILYAGIYIVIAGANLYMLQKKRSKILWTYSIVQLVLTTLYFTLSLYAAPSQSLSIFSIIKSYGFDAMSPWPIVVLAAAFALNTWAADGFLLYRCYAVCRANAYVFAIPTFLYLVTVIASIASLVVDSTPGAVCSTHAVQVADLCFWTCSIAVNIYTSCLISVRFWIHRRAMIRTIGYKQGTFYLGYKAMTLESAALYMIFAIVALVIFVVNSQLENIVQPIAPSLIIYRISRGISLETDQRGVVSAIVADLRFSACCQPQTAVKSLHGDSAGGSGTMHASSGERDENERVGAVTFI